MVDGPEKQKKGQPHTLKRMEISFECLVFKKQTLLRFYNYFYFQAKLHKLTDS